MVGYGAEEPVGWEQQWRAQQCASAAVKFAWRSSGCAVELPDPRTVAAATTVWLAFDGLPPLQDIQDVLAANRGVWLPTAALEEGRLQAARERVQAD